jgi:hypothetical protein
MRRGQPERKDPIRAEAILRLNGPILGIVSGGIAAVGLFLMTNWLVVKGGPNVGQHLGVLSRIFIGYSVTFVGSLLGLPYAFAAGFVTGWLVARLYNLVVSWRHE